jgi:hypothetical protein
MIIIILAANSYSLPPLLGPKIPTATASNAYSMTSRTDIGSFKQDLAKTPGPARYRYNFMIFLKVYFWNKRFFRPK